MKRLPSGRNISIDSLDMERFCEKFGRENVKVLEKSIEKAVKMH